MANKRKTSESIWGGFLSLAGNSGKGVCTLRKKGPRWATFQRVACSPQQLLEKRNFIKPAPHLITFIDFFFLGGSSGVFKEMLRAYQKREINPVH
jgi:hypothetical protein